MYGYPALVAAVDRRVYLDLDIVSGQIKMELRSHIPKQSGMGSSAALAVVEQAALLYLAGQHQLDRKRINILAFELEKAAHGNPSGVDNTIAINGGILLYQKEKSFKKLTLNKLPQFLLVNTGKPVETTKEMVEKIKIKYPSPRQKKSQSKAGPPRVENIKNNLAKIGSLPKKFVEALKFGNVDNLSHLIIENERCLEELGVVGEKAIRVIKEIRQIGGAAKICGAGGIKNGSGIALVYHQDLTVIKKYCSGHKLKFFEVKLGGEGLREETFHLGGVHSTTSEVAEL